jgi:hypothetical protein
MPKRGVCLVKKALESKLPDADMQAAPKALLRAARRAREIARKTGTPLVVVIDGQAGRDAGASRG